MLYLRTFGGLRLEASGESDADVLTQRRPLALLAYLAAAGDLGVARDKLLSVFWPEKDTDRARGALKQLTFALRRDTGEDEVVVGRDQLRLNPLVIRSDVGDFNAAAASSNADAMLILYRGPFLDGVHVSGANDFERWADADRARLIDLFQRTVTRIANEAESAGDIDLAARMWRRLVDTDPLSSRFAIGMIRSLAESGNREAAIRYGEKYAQTVSRELGCSVDPAVTGLLATLRASKAELANKLAAKSAESELPLPSAPGVSRSGRVSRFANRRRLGVIAGGIAVVAIGTAAIAARRNAHRPHTIMEAYAERRARWESNPNGRVFIETPINLTGRPDLDSVSRNLTGLYQMLARTTVRTIPDDSVKAIERFVSSQLGVIGPRQRLTRANAQIGVMTVLRIEGDSLRISVTFQRLVDHPNPVSWGPQVPRPREVPSRSDQQAIETWPVVVVAQALGDKPRKLIVPVATAMAKALKSMRSCDLDDHLEEKSPPWCWRKENELDLVPGYFDKDRSVRTASR